MSQYQRTHALAYFTKYNDNGFVDGFAFVGYILWHVYSCLCASVMGSLLIESWSSFQHPCALQTKDSISQELDKLINLLFFTSLVGVPASPGVPTTPTSPA